MRELAFCKIFRRGVLRGEQIRTAVFFQKPIGKFGIFQIFRKLRNCIEKIIEIMKSVSDEYERGMLYQTLHEIGGLGAAFFRNPPAAKRSAVSRSEAESDFFNFYGGL